MPLAKIRAEHLRRRQERNAVHRSIIRIEQRLRDTALDTATQVELRADYVALTRLLISMLEVTNVRSE